jgi:hypothetical protein
MLIKPATDKPAKITTQGPKGLAGSDLTPCFVFVTAAHGSFPSVSSERGGAAIDRA